MIMVFVSGIIAGAAGMALITWFLDVALRQIVVAERFEEER